MSSVDRSTRATTRLPALLHATPASTLHLLGRLQAQPERDLNFYLDSIWQEHFSDITRVNTVQIAYRYPWKRRLGVIRLSLDNETTFIGINTLLEHPSAPEHVLITTIAHELAHYAHGFGSPLPRLYLHPHANNVVNRELEQRGLGELVRLCDEWIDEQWLAFYEMCCEDGAPIGVKLASGRSG